MWRSRQRVGWTLLRWQPYDFCLFFMPQESRSEDEDALLQSHDGQQLVRILDELTEHKEDSQQRTWAVHEDEGIIFKLLKELLSILVSRVLWCFWSVRFRDISGQSGFYDVSSQSREISWRFWSVSCVTSDQSGFLIITQFLYYTNLYKYSINDHLFYLPMILTMKLVFGNMLIEFSLFLHVAGCQPFSLPSCV